ncbi:MAG: ATP-binding protein [Erysipelotrichaceae bacterium]|nr:ATP-binding protein [Erysipelotrichaceae bacterium]
MALMCLLLAKDLMFMLKELIAECADYDYKVSVEAKKPRSWLKTVSAFANGVGGSLFFGISDEGNVVGLKNIKEDSERISELIKARDKGLLL